MNILDMAWWMSIYLNLFNFACKLMMIPFVSRVTFHSSILNSRVAIISNWHNWLIMLWKMTVSWSLSLSLSRLLLILIFCLNFLLKWRVIFCHKKWFTVILPNYWLTAWILISSFYLWSFPKKIYFLSQIVYFFVFLNYLNFKVLYDIFLPQFLSI